MKKRSSSVKTNNLKLNKTYSSLKIPSLIQNKEQSELKQENDYIHQKLDKLESTISSLIQHTVTKEEMKEMIKEGLSPIIDILFLGRDKETTTTEKTQKSNVIVKEKKEEKKEVKTEKKKETITKNIKRIHEIMQSEELDSSEYGIYSLIEIEDKRIASGGDGNISISSYDINKKKWKRDIHEENAHNGSVRSLCSLSNKRLLSGSYDHSIKVWTISEVELTQIKEIQEHTNTVYKVIPLSQERFASCSSDSAVKIWKDDNTYECLSTLEHNGWISSIIQLKGKDVLVSCGLFSSTGVSFWDLNNYTQQQTIKGYGVYYPSHMIELSDGNIALSTVDEPYPIVIIDSSSYQVTKEIQLEQHITSYSSLCVFNQNSFIYAYKGTFLQISSEDYSIVFQSTGGKFNGYGGIIPIEGGKYFIIENESRISVVKTYDV